MLRDIILEEYERIDDEAERRKKEVCYIAALAQKNYAELVEISGSDDGRKLFDFTRKALRQVQTVETVEVSLSAYVDRHKFLHEAVLLGWVKVKEFQSMMDRQWLRAGNVTDLGEKVVEDYKRFKEIIGTE